MKIIIDLSYTPSGGSLTQVLNMITELNLINEIDLIIYSKKSNIELIKGVVKDDQVVLSSLANISVITRVLWEQLLFPFYIKRENADILFCPGNIGPVYSPIKSIIWIGTIGPFFDDFYKNFRWLDKIKLYLNKFFMIACSRRANAVIFESKFTKDLFIHRYKIRENKSYVINIGFDNFFTNKENKTDNYNFSEDLINHKYLLCVSHLYPYKNIIRLLVAFQRVVNSFKQPLRLIIAGSRDYEQYNNKIEKCIDNLGIQNNVILLGKVSKKKLKFLYENSQILVFPSPFENFAYTLVEAMSCGAPIVCSNTTAMPETCKNAAIYFDPYNIDEITEKITLVLTNEKLRQEMINKSIARSKELPDYNNVTLQTLDIMKKLVSEHL
mgnify:CR=1 FL=1